MVVRCCEPAAAFTRVLTTKEVDMDGDGQIRQGDVLLVPVDNVAPAAATTKVQVILAEGEITGHAHRLSVWPPRGGQGAGRPRAEGSSASREPAQAAP